MRVPGLSLTTAILRIPNRAQRRREVDRGAPLSHELRQALAFGVDLTMDESFKGENLVKKPGAIMSTYKD